MNAKTFFKNLKFIMKLLTTIITIVMVYNYSKYIVELDVALLGKNGVLLVHFFPKKVFLIKLNNSTFKKGIFKFFSRISEQ
jgi:hypothetical protein